MSVSYWVDGDRLHIDIEDEGIGFNSKKVPDPTENSNIMKVSGRGVHLIKKLMDKVMAIVEKEEPVGVKLTALVTANGR